MTTRTWVLVLGILLGPLPAPAGPLDDAGPAAAAEELAGLWEARLRFGPDVRGPLLLTREGDGWRGEIAGHTVPASLAGETLELTLPAAQGSFRGRFTGDDAPILGHWIQPATDVGGPYASPVTLTAFGPGRWRGTVRPVDLGMTFYLLVAARPDGSTGAVLRNPERNAGFNQYPVDSLVREADTVRLLAAGEGEEPGRVLLEGTYHAEHDVLSVLFPTRGGTFDFRRVDADEPSDFYPRGRPTAGYVYAPPPTLDDGWPTASLEDVGISRTAVERAMRSIVESPQDSMSTTAVHGLLVARHGKLVLEEYFHGEHRDKPHDTRSASKSLAADLAGAAIHAGRPVAVADPVYATMNGGTLPPGLEPRKQALTLEHLLTMSSGLDCDEEDESSPGNEENLQGPDFYGALLGLRMVHDPGTQAVYCSQGANLVAGVVARASGEHTLPLFHELVAEPLQVETYYLGLSPTGDAYFGGGARFLPRDFMKLGQVHLDGGTWNGRRVFSEEWSRRATSPLTKFSPESRAGYGYLWWVYDFQYRDRTVRGFFASGNGGQEVIGIPELDLVVATYAGHYNDWETGARFLREIIPGLLLAAVEDDAAPPATPE